ncbi:MAG: fused MFS/spermidine synthase [Gammaproteobacteria bacterium]|nr:fused MFS/spermidine synthase [Gammaproteobacteria bacterium]
MSKRLQLFWFGLVVFLSSALLMILEIVAGRIIAPYVGVSLYTWSSVIGIVLGGLSLGNWLGGRWADNGAGEKEVGITLLVSSASSIAILFLLTLLAPMIQAAEINLLGASFLYVLGLFFIPSTLLGVITPVLTTMGIKLDTRAGHIVGRMNALSALGSILGTFAAGFWLIQFFGTRNIVISVSVLLFIMGSLFLFRFNKKLMLILFMVNTVIGGVTYLRGGFQAYCDKESAYFCIRVVNAADMVPRGDARAMVLDHLVHGINYRHWPDSLFTPYVHLMDELVQLHLGEQANRAKYFFAGGGAYTSPRAVKAHSPQASITVSEIDKDVTRLAEERLFVDTDGMNILHMDARMALESMADGQFDVVVGDVFTDVVVPYHLLTREYNNLVSRKLQKNGLYVLNVVDIPHDPQLLKSMYKTLSAVFSYVDIWAEHRQTNIKRYTYVLSARHQQVMPETISARKGFKRDWKNVTSDILATGTAMNAIPVLTDDYAPVERLSSDLVLKEFGL